MSREEELARRLCKCLGFTVKPVIGGVITIVAPDQFGRYPPSILQYESWNTMLFGAFDSYGLCEPQFGYLVSSSLDELELQLSARGF